VHFSAAILEAPGSPLNVRQVEAADPRPTEVLVRIGASGLCHTDLEVMRGSLAYPTPVVLGHEAAGIVERIGADVASVAVGDHVVASWNPACGQCFYCQRDQPILCETCARANASGGLWDATSRLSNAHIAVHQFNLVSAHAEYAVIPASGAIRISPELPFDQACLIGCGVMTGYGAIMNVAGLRRGETALVVGCGAVGLNAVQAARLAGADRIIAVDVNQERLDLALELGATDAIDPRIGDPQVVLSLTQGRGADVSIEAAGAESSISFAIEAARPGGRVVILGKTAFDSTIRLRFGSLMGEKRIVRSSYGGARPSRDFPVIANAALAGALRLDRLIDRRLKLAEINEGFDAMMNGSIVRAIITH
jgi:S-(hydroxymethyl)glutathione dehydrogenase/alcohol dehydrogenase